MRGQTGLTPIPIAHRIHLNIGKRRPEVGVVERTGIESPLPDMAAGRHARVPIGCVPVVGLLESLRQGLGGSGNHHQMHVIAHQTVAQQGEAMEFRILPQQLEVGNAVGIVGQDDLPRVAALGHMVGNVNDDHARQSSHPRKISERIRFAARRRPIFASPFGSHFPDRAQQLGSLPSVPALVPRLCGNHMVSAH